MSTVEHKNCNSEMQTGSGSESEAPAEQGPLLKLTEQAANNKWLRKVHDNVPSPAKAVLHKGKQPATDAIAAVDKTLQTDEARRLATSALDFFNASIAFILLLLTYTVSTLESTLRITTPTTAETETETEEQKQEETINAQAAVQKKEQSEISRHHTQAISLYHRYKAVGRTVVQKLFSAQSTSRTAVPNQQQQHEYDPYSLDKVVGNSAKQGFRLVKQAGAYSLSRASHFSGPGSSAIVPAADYVISKLPENAKLAVNESTSPF